MCIQRRLTAKESKAYLAKKPDIIKVWKVIHLKGYSRYSQAASRQQHWRVIVPVVDLAESKIHHARTEPSRKIDIPYKPGFHCYVTERAAMTIARKAYADLVYQEFFIRKQWITEIGYAKDSKYKCYVSKKITCDRSLLKG